jgi:formamidopyrimidine-DNA glycosylase
MPELPEVETLKCQLKQVIFGAKILKTSILDKKLSFRVDLAGRTVVSLSRRGKELRIGLDDGSNILLHLRMTGRLLWQKDSALCFPHTRFSITFNRGRLDLIDPRRFATLRVEKGHIDFYTEAMDFLEDFSAPLIREIGRKKKLPIKSFLVDQRFIIGIGNIYACEILYAVSISPLRRTCDISPQEWTLLADSSTEILKRAIACRGTTVSDWRDLFGQKGEYQDFLKVYGRKGAPCPRCGAEIERLKLAGRGTYYCPGCQT